MDSKSSKFSQVSLMASQNILKFHRKEGKGILQRPVQSFVSVLLDNNNSYCVHLEQTVEIKLDKLFQSEVRIACDNFCINNMKSSTMLYCFINVQFMNIKIKRIKGHPLEFLPVVEEKNLTTLVLHETTLFQRQRGMQNQVQY